MRTFQAHSGSYDENAQMQKHIHTVHTSLNFKQQFRTRNLRIIESTSFVHGERLENRLSIFLDLEHTGSTSHSVWSLWRISATKFIDRLLNLTMILASLLYYQD